jgi:hypothetical protein
MLIAICKIKQRESKILTPKSMEAFQTLVAAAPVVVQPTANTQSCTQESLNTIKT